MRGPRCIPKITTLLLASTINTTQPSSTPCDIAQTTPEPKEQTSYAGHSKLNQGLSAHQQQHGVGMPSLCTQLKGTHACSKAKLPISGQLGGGEKGRGNDQGGIRHGVHRSAPVGGNSPWGPQNARLWCFWYCLDPKAVL